MMDLKGLSWQLFLILSRFTYDNFDVLPAIYSGAFIDTHLHEHFKPAGVWCGSYLYLADVKFTHRHYRVTKDAPDETYKRRDRFGDDLAFLQNVKIRYSVSLEMRHYIQTGDKFSSPRSDDVVDGIVAAFSYYLFACPGYMGYRLRMICYFIARLFYTKLFK